MAGIELVAATWSRGLRPPSPGQERGARWVPAALLWAAGLGERLKPARVKLPHPAHDFEKQLGTRIGNGITFASTA